MGRDRGDDRLTMTWPIGVFACYARPPVDAAGFDLAAWSAKFIATLDQDINPPLLGEWEATSRVEFCPRPPPLPGTMAPSEVPDPDTAVEQSGVLLVLLSPQLLADPARLAEIARFRAQAALDGRKPDHTVVVTIAATPYEAGQNADIDWLFDGGKRAGARQGFTAADGTPLEADRAGPGKPFAALLQPIALLAGDIRSRVEALKGTRRQPQPLPEPQPLPQTEPEAVAPEVPLDAVTGNPSLAPIYLWNETSKEVWGTTRTALEALGSVRPTTWVPPPSFATLRTREDQRRRALIKCRGMILVRADPADPTDLMVDEAQADRIILQDEDYPVPPWVLIDWVQDPEPVFEAKEKLSRITTEKDGWIEDVRKELKL